MPQTSVDDVNAIGFEGLIYDIAQERDIISKLSAVAAITPGHLGVWKATNADTVVVLPVLTTDVTDGTAWGVAIADTSRQTNAAQTGADYLDEEAVPLMRKGRIWVISEDAVATVGLPAFVRFSATGGEKLGAFRTDADTADAVALPGATFRSTTAGAGELVILELNL